MRGSLAASGLLLASCSVTPIPAPLAEYPAPNRTQLEKLGDAWASLSSAPDDLDRIVWYGRRTAYLGAYDHAIAIYSAGLERHPGSPRLLRHRGHRYITVGRFGAAVVDLRAAARAIEGSTDLVEQDGLPNARNVPTSTLHTNVWYHLGLAHYLRGEFDAARVAYAHCLAKARNRDMEVAARYWLYLSTRRAGIEGAASVLEPVRADWDIIENTSYHRLLLLFRGDLGLAAFGSGERDQIQSATLAYGLARYQLENGAAADGWRRLAELVQRGPAAAFGTIAARVDLSIRDREGNPSHGATR